MFRPHLLFCPYLPVTKPIVFADWELAPLNSFEDRWSDRKFKLQATGLLRKFVGPDIGRDPIADPALLCRKGARLDGEIPTPDEYTALELALAFAFVDSNPRCSDELPPQLHRVVTADNAELFAWPIDVEQGHVTPRTGYLVLVSTGGYKISDCELAIRPPLDLHMPVSVTADPLVLTGIYKTVLESLTCPGANATADRVRLAVTWFAKAWRNTATLHYPERLVFLKTAFEALTGTSDTPKGARKLRKVLEALPRVREEDAARLVWSPAERPVPRKWANRKGNEKEACLTDLETWFREFGLVRNAIVHDGQVPSGDRPDFIYPAPKPVYEPVTCRIAYHGPFFWTAEYLLRGVIKALLSVELGYENAWRTEDSREWEEIRRDFLTSARESQPEV